MDFISNEEPQIKEMLRSIGFQSVEELFESVPAKLRIPKPVNDDGISEFEGIRLMESLAAKNAFVNFDNYLGAGSYEHHVPALVGAVCSKAEFLTSYTPYQPEASQGMLQAIFEFQSAICALTGLDVSNASLYDGASACAEALLMSLRVQKGRNKVVVARSLHPQYHAVVEQYLDSHGTEIVTIPFLDDGRIDQNALSAALDEKTAAALIPYPNFFGIVEDVKEISKKAKKTGTLTILSANPMVYGLYASAKELGADIAVGDCQPFGIPMQYGGPYAGYFACRQELLRQIPGRLVGETRDTEGRRGFVLTLQAREQHIRREKATSNMCTNQALAALASLVAILWYGKQGLQKLALTNYQRAAYLKSQLQQINGFRTLGNAPIFNEFAVQFPQPASEVQKVFHERCIEPGLDLGKFYPELDRYFLIAVTETKSKQQLDNYIEVAKKL